MAVWNQKKTLRSLEEDIWQLRNRVDQLESAAKIGKLEAAEVYDKTLRLMQRMAKRYQVDMKDNGSQPPEASETSSEDGIDPISRTILARRGTRRPTQ
ncbi:hypothetical protein LCGC14_2861860 [marine sediment metagenome]|uniref:Uncharacterized protein n=1 Tax=marine sediment metagenome TaxID=412755 RepID=A0A0F8Y5A3_9ZZZZ